MPREDGLYVGESNPEFLQLYVQTWDALEAKGKLTYDVDGMAENRVILRITRYKMQLRHGWTALAG